MNYEETLKAIHMLGNFSMPAGLERIRELMRKLENPQNEFRAIHIAGTNGKGSVSAMLAKIFQTAGYQTGLYISPYILDFRERIQINGQFISKSDLVKYSETIRNTGAKVTEFEFITAVAFLYFKEKNCEIVIVETGLGGRLDATNVLKRVDAAVLTKIGFDHSEILGDTLEKISDEKCGIIKSGCKTVSSVAQKKEALERIKKADPNVIIPDFRKLQIKECDIEGSVFIYRGKEYRLSLCGKYQIENALTAIEAVCNSVYNIPYETIRAALENVYFPARAEVICKKPLCLLDGAHNPDAAQALSGLMESYHGKITAIIGVMRDKDYESVLNRTLIHCKAAVAITVDGMERSLNAENLKTAAERYCYAESARDYASAVERAFELSGGEPIFVFGSLYLASGLRDELYKFYKNFS